MVGLHNLSYRDRPEKRIWTEKDRLTVLYPKYNDPIHSMEGFSFFFGQSCR